MSIGVKAALKKRGSSKVVKAIAFDPDVLSEVDRIAQEIGTNRSSFINRLLFSYLLGGKVQHKQRRAD